MVKTNDMVKTFMDKGYVVNNDLTNSSYVTLEDDKYSIYVSTAESLLGKILILTILAQKSFLD